MANSASHSVDDNLIEVWPSRGDASEMLGVPESTLSRHSDMDWLHRQDGSHRCRPTAVLEAGAYYKRRSLNALAAKLLAYAREHGEPEQVEQVRAEVDEFFSRRTPLPANRERVLGQARRALPRALFLEVQRAFDQGVLEEPELQGSQVDFGSARSAEAG